jgi:hypothetical protein
MILMIPVLPYNPALQWDHMVMDEVDKVDREDREDTVADMVKDTVADTVEDIVNTVVDNNHMDMTCSTKIKVYFTNILYTFIDLRFD